MSRLPRFHALWQRNLLAAVVLLAALATFWATELRTDWSEYRNSVVPEYVVPAGGALSVGGVTWRVDSVRHLSGADRKGFMALPEGTVLNVIRIDRDGAEEGDQTCNGVITDGHRDWTAESVIGFTPTLATDGISTNCGGPGPVQFAFVLPRDAVPTAVDVVGFDRRIIVRLEL